MLNSNSAQWLSHTFDCEFKTFNSEPNEINLNQSESIQIAR